MKIEDITTLYTDSTGDMGNTYEYRWNARWTAKSLIVTADPTDERIPLAFREDKYVIPRKKANRDLHYGDYGWNGSIYHRPSGNLFEVQPFAERQRRHQEQMEADPAYQQQMREQQQREVDYAALSESRKEIIKLWAKKEGWWPNIGRDESLFINNLIENGGEELWRAKLTGKTYRSIDAV
jgi:hypothetical protein